MKPDSIRHHHFRPGRVFPFSLPGLFYFNSGAGLTEAAEGVIRVHSWLCTAAIFFGLLAICPPPPCAFSSELTCTAHAPDGMHRVKVVAVYKHLEPNETTIWTSTAATTSAQPMLITATAQGFPVAYHIYIDGAEVAYCGADPRIVFSDGFESGGFGNWSYSGPRIEEADYGNCETD